MARSGTMAVMVVPLLVAASLVALVVTAARSPRHPVPEMPQTDELSEALTTVGRVDQVIEQRWQAAGVTPAEAAEDRTVLRRLSLALHGTIPSLEELRRFDVDTDPHRIERWTLQMLRDRRFADYFAARLARSLIGSENGQFIIFRRDRFTQWLADEIAEGRPFDQLVREMIASQGLWTGVPATNYITQAADDGVVDPNKLAGRTVRAFLGQRIDCAQCHNHPFADWKQQQFEGLAACYGQAQVRPTGIEDDFKKQFKINDRMTLKDRTVAPAVPFGQEWWPEEGTDRQRLAAWVTHPENVRFERALANRTWGLLFGRPWHNPVDDLPNPPTGEAAEQDLLNLLGADFRTHDYDLRRLVFVISTSRAFRLSSQHPAYTSGEGIETVEAHWAAYPLVRLRPEQMIGAMVQAASIKTIDQNSHLFTRTLKFFRSQDFVRDYGDLGELELEERGGTIPQALLRMNGRFAREVAEASPVSASGRIATMAPTDVEAVETTYLCCLARRPSPEELAAFLTLEDGQPKPRRSDLVEDVYWTLFNSPEFCWNH